MKPHGSEPGSLFRLAAIAIAASIAVPGGVHAQAGPAFEVSRSASFGPRDSAISRTPQRLAMQGILAQDIVAFAYGLPLDRIDRRPQWMYDDHYDIAVTTTVPASLAEQKLMLQKLLQERFGMVVHRNTYPSPVYFLVRGPEVKLTPAQQASAPAEFEVLPRFGGRMDRAISMSDFAEWLYAQLQLPVVDKTGLTGLFDIRIAPDPRGASEGTIRAVQNSLGLNLERHQGTAESLVIEQSKRPQAD